MKLLLTILLALLLTASLAGCASFFDTRSDRDRMMDMVVGMERVAKSK